MTEKELRKLSSKRLMELLAEQTENANRLEQENERLKKRVTNREQHLARMGELAKSILHSDGDPDTMAAIAGEDLPIIIKEPPEVPESRSGEGEPYINDENKDEYRIYKVFDATVGRGGISYTLVDGKKDVPEGSHFSLKNGYVVYDGATLEDGCLPDEDTKAIAAYVGGDRPYKAIPITGEGLKAISVEPGYYYITTTDGSVAMVVSASSDAAAAEAVEPPDITLAVTSGDNMDRMADENGNIMIQAGAAAHFTITIDVKKGARNYRLINTMDKRLRRENSRIMVYTVNRDDQWSVLDAQYWSQSWDMEAEPGHDILTFAFYEDDTHRGTIPDDVVQIVVAYDVVVGDGLWAGAANAAKVEYDGAYTPDSVIKVYNAQITVSKVAEADKDGRNTTIPVTGASFMIGRNPTEDGGYQYYYAYDSMAGQVGWTDMPSKAAVMEADMGPDGNQAEFTGLEAGTYYLLEKDAPAGYLKADDLQFEIKADDYGPENLKRETDVANYAGTTLPSTGSLDTRISTAGGGFQLILGSTALHITNKRRQGE